MFWFLVDVLALRRLGLSRPFRYLLLVIFFGCLIAGLLYAVVVFNAVRNSSEPHHVQHHSSH